MNRLEAQQKERIADLYPLVRAVVARYANTVDQLDDWVQEAFIEIIGALRGLRQPEAIGSWATTIARRTCYRLMSNARQAETAELFQDAAVAAEGGTAGREELRKAVHRSLERVSGKHRRVLVLHYLDGLPVARIAEEVDVPAGTVKRWLHEGRNSLRKELTIMPETQTIRDATHKPFAHFMLWGEGSQPGTMSRVPNVWPWTLFGSLLAQKILFSARKKPRTLAEICRDVDANAQYVEDMIRTLIKAELMVREDERSRTDFFFLDKGDQRRLHDLFTEYGRNSARIVVDSLDAVRAACRPELLWGTHTDWENVRWPVVCVFMCNLAVRRHFTRVFGEIEPPLRPDGHHLYLFAWEGEHSMDAGGWKRGFGIEWVTGCNTFLDDTAGFFWTPQAQREVWPRLHTPVVSAMFGPEPVSVDQLREALPELNSEQLESTVARLAEIGLLERDDDGLRPGFPVFTKQFWSEVGPVLAAMADRIGSEGADVLFARMEGLFDELGFGMLHDQYRVAKACASSGALHHTLQELHSQGVVPDPPSKVAPNWGFWGSEIPCPLMSR